MSLEALGWSEHFRTSFVGSESLGSPHRVVAQQRGQNRISDGASNGGRTSAGVRPGRRRP